MKICPNCDFQNQDDNSFCQMCGAPLSQQRKPEYNAPYYAPPAYTPQPQPPKQKNNTIPILVAIVLIVLILTIGAIIIFKGKTPAPAPETTTMQETTETTTETTTTTTTAPPTYEPETAATPAPTAKDYTYDGYLFPSDRELLTTSYLNTLSKDRIDLIRNEIYARHGYIFQTEKYRTYFEKCSWYYGYETDMDKVQRSFNSIENRNIDILVKYQGLSQ